MGSKFHSSFYQLELKEVFLFSKIQVSFACKVTIRRPTTSSACNNHNKYLKNDLRSEKPSGSLQGVEGRDEILLKPLSRAQEIWGALFNIKGSVKVKQEVTWKQEAAWPLGGVGMSRNKLAFTVCCAVLVLCQTSPCWPGPRVTFLLSPLPGHLSYFVHASSLLLPIYSFELRVERKMSLPFSGLVEMIFQRIWTAACNGFSSESTYYQK